MKNYSQKEIMKAFDQVYRDWGLVHKNDLGQKVKKVKFSGPATIVFWSDGTKTVVKKSPSDICDYEKALAMAIVKKEYGNNYFRRMEKLLKDAEYEGVEL